MFEKFIHAAYKNFYVDAQLFELIAVYGVRVISVLKSESEALEIGDTFTITCDDAVVICEVDKLHSSEVDDCVTTIRFGFR
ncbi:hypothetical protein A9G28_09805 [Gilliamella sp. Fer1-1]|nr:hypothetical protein A9G28_09805 [Gilliamella apicola]